MHDLNAFANRLAKTAKARRPWARRLGIEAYRVYDGDIPELRFIVDVFAEHAVVYDRSTRVEAVMPWTEAELATVTAAALGLAVDHVHVKMRRRMPGASQYGRLAEAEIGCFVAEETSRYWVNLSDYLDTGLFLDHRPLRSRFRRQAGGRSLLNLFCYTGSVSVAAAQAGARTTSVDLSNTYLEWARKNFTASGLDPNQHAFIRADAREFLAAGPGGEPLYDLVFLDPPTFSNSKRMTGSFDVQRDHRRLIDLAMRFLAPAGELYFSTNRQNFVLDASLPKHYAVEDITASTIPEDFRQKTVHRCFVIRHVT